MDEIEIEHLDGTIEKHVCPESFITAIGYCLVFSDESRIFVSPSVINKLRVRKIQGEPQ